MSTHIFPDIGKARVLISNDDGFHARGIRTLVKVMAGLAREVWVIAPTEEQSCAGHALTLRQPLRIRKRAIRRYTVDGTPTDCVLLGLHQIMRDRRPDLVVSGINRGSNLGDDVTYSGTIAAAMESTILGVPSIAFSQHYQDNHPVKWATGAHWIPGVLKKLRGFECPGNCLLNVNFPDVIAGRVTGIEVTRQGARKFNDLIQPGSDPRGNPYYWIGAQQLDTRNAKGTDMSAVLAGAISITPLSVDLTDRKTMKRLKNVYG